MALDIGDAWTGIAVTDASGSFARPETTVATQNLEPFLMNTFSVESIKTIIVGYPRTMKGGESAQTLKTVAYKDHLAHSFPEKEFILWDERLSSKRAQALAAHKRSREEKLKEHARAAAFILDSYLTFVRTREENSTLHIDSNE